MPETIMRGNGTVFTSMLVTRAPADKDVEAKKKKDAKPIFIIWNVKGL